MQIELVWDEDVEGVVRWQFSGFIGVVNYLRYMNDVAMMTITSDYERVDCVVDIAHRMPLPDRDTRNIRQAILAAPPSLRLVVIAVRNPVTRLVLDNTIGTYSDLGGRLEVVRTLDEARALIVADRAG